MESYLFTGIHVEPDSLVVEGYHKPGSLTQASGVWVHAAGHAMLSEPGTLMLNQVSQWVWFTVKQGALKLHWKDMELDMTEHSSCFLPAGSTDASITVQGPVEIIWFSLEGQLASMVVRKMGALLHSPLRQTALPSQIYLAEHIVQVIVRHTGTSHATYQLQHLLYGMLASQWGQPVAMDAMLSHEIAKVVDTLRANQYRDNFSLAEMAAISRMPIETFRKRFVNEVGMPPLSYILHCKMERAKELLRDQNYTVRQAGIEVGMSDPYHFSKQFKNIVGISPSAFIKQAADPNAATKRTRVRRAKTAEESVKADS